MKSAQVVARGKVELVELPIPNAAPGHVLVRSALLSLCGSDIAMLHYSPEGAYPFAPGTTGHEMVGRVEAVGGGVTGVHVGDRVLALAPDHRAMCEFFLAPIEHIVPLPEKLPLEQLLQAQQLGTVLYACQRLPNVIGKTIAVVGQGSAGLWFDFQLRRLGAQKVIALDIEEFRLNLAAQYGASQTIHNLQNDPAEEIRRMNDGELADLVVEAAGEVDSINLAIDLVRANGEILYFGLPRSRRIEFNFDKFFHKCCRTNTIVGAATETNQRSTRIALDLIASGAADPKSMITHRIPFSEVRDAYAMHHRRSDGAVKIVVQMPT